MSGVTFRRIAPDESRVYRQGEHVGDVYALDDCFARAFGISRSTSTKIRAALSGCTTATAIREVTERLVSSHPLRG